MAETKLNLNNDKTLDQKKNEKVVHEKIIKGQAKVRKKSELQKFANTFVAEDVSKVKEFVLVDVLVPAIKKAISDIVVNGIDILLYGEAGRSNRFKGPADKVSFRDYSNVSRRNNGSLRNARLTSTYDYDDIILSTRGEAEQVIMQMDEIIDRYGVVRVADFYEMVGVTGQYTDNKYGWTDIRSAEPVRVRDGYLIKLPRALPID